MELSMERKLIPQGNYDYFISWIEVIPPLNYLYDIFFDNAPPLDAVKELLNLTALVATLLLGASIQLAACLSFDELQQADQIWTNTSSYYNSLWESGANYVFRAPITPSAAFASGGYLTTYILFSALLLVVVVYIDCLAKEDKTLSSQAQDELHQMWWRYARVAVFTMLTLITVGIFWLCNLFQAVVQIRVPSDCNQPTMTFNAFAPYDCVYPRSQGMTALIMWTTLYSMIGVMCYGTAVRYRFLRANPHIK